MQYAYAYICMYVCMYVRMYIHTYKISRGRMFESIAYTCRVTQPIVHWSVMRNKVFSGM